MWQRHSVFWAAMVLLCLVSIHPLSAWAGKTAKATKSSGKASALAELPLYFEQNQGQTDVRARFLVKGRTSDAYFTNDGILFHLTRPGETTGPSRTGKIVPASNKNQSPRGWWLKLSFVGATPQAPEGLDRTRAVISYFKGAKDQWKAGLPTYGRIVYRDLWPGIDLVFGSAKGKLKYTFVVRPGADPRAIQLAWSGAQSVTLTDGGGLEVRTPLGGLDDDAPVSHQMTPAGTRDVATALTLDQAGDSTRVRFKVGSYDRTASLYIDPGVLLYCGYIGGNLDDFGYGIAVDAAGSAYVTGATQSTEATFPVTVGPDLTHNGNRDVFVAKVNAAGTALEYCGFIGGNDDEYGYGIAVDAAGSAYVAGVAQSTEATFPVTVGPDLTHDGNYDAFVAKVNAAGTALEYCGFIGGNDDEYGYGIAVDGAGCAYVTGSARSDEATFPETVGPDLTHNGGYDAFVAKVNAAGTALEYCGYIGGNGNDEGNGIAVDGSGSAYVTGITYSTEATFPVTAGPDLTHNGNDDAFVVKVNAAGTALEYCGYIGGNGSDPGWGIAVDGSGSAYVTGITYSTEATFPVTVGPDLTHNGSSDAFVAKVNAAGSALDYCGYVGGNGLDYGYGIAVDGSGSAYVTGYTYSTEATFPVAVGPDLTFNGGTYDAFVAKVNATGTALEYCGYIGGNGGDAGNGVAVDGSGSAYVAGQTASDETTFPVTVGPDLTFYGGTSDAFVARISGDTIPTGGGGSGGGCFIEIVD